MKPKLLKIKHWITSHRKQSLAIGGALLIAIAAGGAAWAWALTTPGAIDNAPLRVKKPPQKYYSPLTGVEVKDEAATKQAVTAIMIENSPDARPQSGLKSAGVVYEAVAEAGITRFLALYQQDKPQLIGPVRSLRIYYVDWLAPYQASAAHIGGSKAALDEIRNGNYRDIDQFFNAGAYWRASDRYAPHNVYTSFERLDALNASKGYQESSFKSFARTDPKPAETPNATNIAINFSSGAYNTGYTYNAESNNYTRSLGGAPHLDREAGQIAPSVVVALKVDMTHVLEDGYRESITTSGQGQGYVFQNGSVSEVTWKKADRASPLELVDAEGKPVKLNRGQTWIAAVPNGQGSVSW